MQLASMNVCNDEELRIATFTESFVEQSKLLYGAVVSALLAKEDLSWLHFSSHMLQEYGSEQTSNTVPESAQWAFVQAQGKE